jgi:hypothetical protein
VSFMLRERVRALKSYRTANFLSNKCVEIAIFAFGLGAMHAIFLSPAFRDGNSIDRSAAGQFGDFVGGYVGTLFSLIGVLLIYRTLRNQIRANRRQAFEDKYFVLLQLHRDNVNELALAGKSGRAVFVKLMREFRMILPVVRKTHEKYPAGYSSLDLASISYYILFYGMGSQDQDGMGDEIRVSVGPLSNSSRMLADALGNLQLDIGFLTELEGEFVRLKTPAAKKELGYLPCEGHQSRLGHYFRHLYQTVVYVDSHGSEFEPYEYVKTVRAQLSTHEQALLFLNSLTRIGSPWWSKGLIRKYSMIKNVPPQFFNPMTEVCLVSLFGSGYFEAYEDAECLVAARADVGVKSITNHVR